MKTIHSAILDCIAVAHASAVTPAAGRKESRGPRVTAHPRFLIAFLCFLCLPVVQAGPLNGVKVVHRFAATDGDPAGKLAQASDGTLYGVLSSGGAYQQGSVFKLTPDGQFQTLYSFGSAASAQNAPQGATPWAGVILGGDGNLYGTTSEGGPQFGGTAFKLTPAGQLTTLVVFGGNGLAGTQPAAPLILGPDGNVYGSTNVGGTLGGGTVFRLTPAGVHTILHNFPGDASEGQGLYGQLYVAPDGSVLGTTSNGGLHGTFGSGTVFKIAPDGAFSTLHFFPDTASNHFSGLTAGSDGTLYGTSLNGGSGSGILFSITTQGFYTTLHEFECQCGTSAGSSPVGELTLGSDGNLYGVTNAGGTAYHGTLYQMTPNVVYTPLHSFTGPDGVAPTGGLLEGRDGRFYGMTTVGSGQDAVIFSFAAKAPMSPTSVAISAADGQVTLTWEPARLATSYRLYQATSPGAEGSTPAQTGITDTTVTIKPLENGVTYYYQIVAVSEAGDSPPSPEVSATPVAAPTGLTATAGNGSVALSWSSAAGASSYNVYMGTSTGVQATGAIATGITATSYTVSGLTNGKPYYFKIASVNATASALSASEVSATPIAPATTSGGSGGGGATRWLDLCALGLLALCTRARINLNLHRLKAWTIGAASALTSPVEYRPDWAFPKLSLMQLSKLFATWRLWRGVTGT